MRSVVVGLLAVSQAGAESFPRFVDATPESGIDFKNVCGAPRGSKGWLMETMGAGAGWLDYDRDGNLDLYLVNGSAPDRAAGRGEPNRLFRGNGRGGFQDVTDKTGVGDRGWGYGVAVGDMDNDGDPDLYVTNLGANVLYRNRGDGTFEDVSAESGVASTLWSSSAAFFDMEGDGDLDLYVGNYIENDMSKIPRRGSAEARTPGCMYKGILVVCGPMGRVPVQDVLYRNDGDGTFTDVTRAAGMLLETPRYALGVVTFDFDNDGDQDVYVANDSVRNSLWRNEGNGKFVDVGVMTMTALNADGRPQAGMGTAAGDYDGDGWLDLIVTNFAHDFNTVYRNMQGKFFIDDSALAGMSVTHLNLSWGTGFYDFDHDRDQDLFVANGHIYSEVDDFELGTAFHQANHLFLNREGRLEESGRKCGPGLQTERSFRAAAFGDYDNDGDVDVALTALDDAPLLLRNDTAPRRGSLQLKLVGGPSNRDAVGARVTVRAGGVSQVRERVGGGSYLSASSPWLHFGLGDVQVAQQVEIRWPGGTKRVLADVPAGRLTVHETPQK